MICVRIKNNKKPTVKNDSLHMFCILPIDGVYTFIIRSNFYTHFKNEIFLPLIDETDSIICQHACTYLLKCVNM